MCLICSKLKQILWERFREIFGWSFRLLTWNKSNRVALVYVCRAQGKRVWSACYFYTHEPLFLKSGTKSLCLFSKNPNALWFSDNALLPSESKADYSDLLITVIFVLQRQLRVIWKAWCAWRYANTKILNNRHALGDKQATNKNNYRKQTLNDLMSMFVHVISITLKLRRVWK